MQPSDNRPMSFLLKYLDAFVEGFIYFFEIEIFIFLKNLQDVFLVEKVRSKENFLLPNSGL